MPEHCFCIDRPVFENSLYGGLFSEQGEFCIPLQHYLFNSALGSWVNRSRLERHCYKDLEEQFIYYDGLIGYVIRKCNKGYPQMLEEKENYRDVIDFIDSWKYEGYIFRIIDNKKITYNEKIASWTKNPHSFKEYRLLPNKKYTFLIAKTELFFGFDVNKYGNKVNISGHATQYEDEVIFPMSVQHVEVRFYGTFKEFQSKYSSYFKEVVS